MTATRQERVIVITVPHATCPSDEDTEAWAATGNHACDFAGPRAALSLQATLVSEGQPVFEIREIRGDLPRTVVDMNRFVSRGSLWRKRVADCLSPAATKCLVDAHSFPRDHVPFSGNDVVEYTEGARARWQEDLRAVIVGADGRFKCGFMSNPDTTDIIQDAHEHGVPAVLIEFSEGLDDAALREACQRIARYLINPVSPLVVACHLCGKPARMRCSTCHVCICSDECADRSWEDGMPHRDFCFRRRAGT
jgi:hypothetical protein